MPQCLRTAVSGDTLRYLKCITLSVYRSNRE